MREFRVMILLAAAVTGVALLSSGCRRAASAGESEIGLVSWFPGADPHRDAPSWTRSPAAAVREAGARRREVPARYVVHVGVSEDKGSEQAAMHSALADVKGHHAVWLRGELDRIFPEAAQRAGIRLPQIDTALGARQAVEGLHRQELRDGVVRRTWQARGRRCLVETCEMLYRVYVLARFDQKDRAAELWDAAKRTLLDSAMPGADQDALLKQVQQLIRGNRQGTVALPEIFPNDTIFVPERLF